MRDINLNSAEWCNLIFEGKNQLYGAYALRQTADRRHIMSIVITAVFAAGSLFLFGRMQAENLKAEANKDEFLTAITMADLEAPKEENNIEPIQPKEAVPEVKSTIQLTSIIAISKAEDIKPEEELRTMEDLNTSTAAIGSHNVKGSDDPNAAHPDDVGVTESSNITGNADVVREFVEIMPQFPGGEKELMAFLKKNLKYPVIAAEIGTQGRVVLRFVVGKDGSISNIEVVRPLEASCDKEAVRVIKSMPKWIPGRQNGVPASVYFSLPVRFQLN